VLGAKGQVLSCLGVENVQAGRVGAEPDLLAFGERELASLLGIGQQWTVSLFDAQVGGLALADSLRLGLAPAGLQTVAVVVLLAALLVGRHERAPGWLPARSPGKRSSAVPAYCLFAGALLMVTLVPAAAAFQGVLAAPGALVNQIGLLHDIVASAVLGLAAAASAWLLAGSLARRPWLMVMACLPGLCGSLQVGLVVLALFQLPGLQALSETLVPAVLGLTVVLMPYACALCLLLDVDGAGAALHSAGLLRASPQPVVRRRAAAVAARVAGSGWLWALLILFWLAYCEVTVAALLAPVTSTPAFVRLYNLMHYGRSEVLSVMLVAVVVLPLVLVAGASAVLGQVERRRWLMVAPS
jgi:ABC-type spermidine/putrescine transport system permease subunit II